MLPSAVPKVAGRAGSGHSLSRTWTSQALEHESVLGTGFLLLLSSLVLRERDASPDPGWAQEPPDPRSSPSRSVPAKETALRGRHVMSHTGLRALGVRAGPAAPQSAALLRS